jgi:hypothetical protein
LALTHASGKYTPGGPKPVAPQINHHHLAPPLPTRPVHRAPSPGRGMRPIRPPRKTPKELIPGSYPTSDHAKMQAALPNGISPQKPSDPQPRFRITTPPRTELKTVQKSNVENFHVPQPERHGLSIFDSPPQRKTFGLVNGMATPPRMSSPKPKVLTAEEEAARIQNMLFRKKPKLHR